MKFKVLTATLPAGTNTHTFNSNLIGNDTIIDVYTTDDDVLVVDQEQSGQNVTVTIDNHSEPVGVALVVNNITEAEYPIYTDSIIYDNQGFTVPLNDVIEQIESSARNAGVRAEGALSEITNRINPHLATLDNSVEGLNQSFTQQKNAGFLQKNLFDIAKIVGGYYLNNAFVPQATSDYWGTVVVKIDGLTEITLSGFPNTVGVYSAYLNSENVADFASNAWGSGSNNGTHTLNTNYKYLGIAFRNTADLQTQFPNKQAESGTQATAYTSYAMPNTDLTQIVDSAIDNGYISRNLYDGNGVGTFYVNNGKYVNDSSVRGVYIKCKPNTTYTISRMGGGSRFRIYDSVNIPSSNRDCIAHASDDSATSNTATTSASAQYLYAFVWRSADSMTWEQMKSSIQIEEGNVAHPYTEYAPSNTELKQSLTPQGYTTSGLTFSNCTFAGGGYFKIGNLVVINMRLVLTSANPYPTVSGLPIYDGSANFVPLSAYSVSIGISDHTSGWISPQGVMNIVSGSGNSNNVIISAMYLAK